MGGITDCMILFFVVCLRIGKRCVHSSEVETAFRNSRLRKSFALFFKVLLFGWKVSISVDEWFLGPYQSQ
jgi:hypothetical protein